MVKLTSHSDIGSQGDLQPSPECDSIQGSNHRHGELREICDDPPGPPHKVRDVLLLHLLSLFEVGSGTEDPRDITCQDHCPYITIALDTADTLIQLQIRIIESTIKITTVFLLPYITLNIALLISMCDCRWMPDLNNPLPQQLSDPPKYSEGNNYDRMVKLQQWEW